MEVILGKFTVNFENMNMFLTEDRDNLDETYQLEQLDSCDRKRSSLKRFQGGIKRDAQ